MKISINWIKDFTSVDLPIGQLVDKIGSQLGAIEGVVDLGAKYQGAVIAKVISCENHPDADKLHVCLVDDGGVVKDIKRVDWPKQDTRAAAVSSSERAAEENVRDSTLTEQHSKEGGNVPQDSGVGGSAGEQAVRFRGLVQVVCGANNVAEGQTVIWLPPGIIVPETFGTDEPFKLESKELRGVMSNGMIASARELDFGDNHDGIVVINEEIKPGTSLSESFGLNDFVIDIENKMFTHRPDCFGILGVAREIAGIQSKPFKSPDWYLAGSSKLEVGSSEELPLIVKNELPDLVPRFMAVAMSGIKIQPSSFRLQTFLARVGVKPINNIVDITNYFMLITGQPMHAYDYDKVKALSSGDSAEIIVRSPKDKEKIMLLGGKAATPRQGTIIIATGKQAIGIGGVMGGADTEVDENTKNIILECANFDMYSIRKTAFELGLFTDAVTRFSKGQSPLQNDKILVQAIWMVQKHANGQVASEIIDNNHAKHQSPVTTDSKFINDRLGISLTDDVIASTLRNVEFGVKLQTPNSKLQITPPFWRTDIEIPEDIVEEAGRLIGFDKIPLRLPKRDLSAVEVNKELKLNSEIRNILSAAGANELLTYSFVHGNLIEKIGQNKDLAYQLNNALSPDLQYYRLSLLPSLLEKVHPNIKAGHEKFTLFEIGKTHIKGALNDEKLPQEQMRLACVFAAGKKESGTLNGAPYYQALEYLDNLLDKLGISYNLAKLSDKALPTNEQLVSVFNKERSALVLNKPSGELFGIIGEFKYKVKNSLKLPDYCAGFELDTAQLLKAKDVVKKYRPLSKFPYVEQDITLKTEEKTSHTELNNLLQTEAKLIFPTDCTYSWECLDIFKKEKGFKQVTFRLKIASYKGTLKANEVNGWLDKIALSIGQKINVTRL
jgi:phenylalanyl-tRNA synthetase beta chain